MIKPSTTVKAKQRVESFVRTHKQYQEAFAIVRKYGALSHGTLNLEEAVALKEAIRNKDKLFTDLKAISASVAELIPTGRYVVVDKRKVIVSAAENGTYWMEVYDNG